MRGDDVVFVSAVEAAEEEEEVLLIVCFLFREFVLPEAVEAAVQSF